MSDGTVSDAAVPDDGWPSLAVIMPVRNEAAHLAAAVASVLGQEYPEPFEVCLAVAPSTDGTEAVADRLARDHPMVRVVANPAGHIPAALNTATRATTGEVIVRVDGHSVLPDGYIRRAVSTLRRVGAVNVGGIQHAVGTTPFERAVAVATASFAGTGGASYRTGGAEGPVDTVFLGVFDRRALEAIGGFDERLLRNEDYEVNIRLRAAGGVVWLDPGLVVDYRPRGTVRRLARQYFDYGRWKRAVVRLHPGSLRARQAAPAAVTAAVGAGLLLTPLSRWGLLPAATYATGVVAAALAVDRRHAGRVAVVLATTHLSWGAGFLTCRPATLLRVPEAISGGTPGSGRPPTRTASPPPSTPGARP